MFEMETDCSELDVSTDYLFAGNVIGEMGLLTGSLRNASVVCETAVQVLSFNLCGIDIFQVLVGGGGGGAYIP